MSSPKLTLDEAMQRASRLAEKGQIREAAQLYQQVLNARPDHKKARKALRALQGRAPARAQLTQADFERVAALVQANKLDAAKTEIQRLCHLHPEQPALHNLQGVILKRRGEGDAALAAFQEALRLEPAFAEALNNLGATLSEQKRYREALGCYQELVNRGQADAEVYANLARALRGAGQRDNAEEALRRAIRLRPLYPDAYNDLGNLLNDEGRHEEAIEAYQQALQMKPQHKAALGNLARSYSAMQRHVPAMEAFRALLEIAPQDVAALRGLAQSLAAVGQRTAAIERYEEVLQKDPNDGVSRHLLTALRGDTPQAAAPGYAKAVFESYAANFEKHLTASLEYGLPQRIPALLEQLDGEDAWYPKAIDLGCGTGLVGTQVRSYCEMLLGVDVAEAMLEKAREKAVYDQLLAGDIEAVMLAQTDRFDLVVCADVLVYLGDLLPLFQAVQSRCNRGASFVVSTELLEDGDYRLLPSGRFAHGDDYVRRCADAAGLSVRHSDHIPLRKERGDWLTGGLYVLSAA